VTDFTNNRRPDDVLNVRCRT